MTFVFESRLLPFSNISEAYAARVQPIVAHYALEDLPLWDRCMLAAVLPVVQQRHSVGTPAVPPSTVLSSPPLGLDGSDNADTATAAVVLTSSPPATMRAASNEEKAKASQGMADAPSFEDVALSLTIVRALDELEAVFDSSMSTRAELKRQEEEQQQQCVSGVSAAEATCCAKAQPKRTSEEILMEQLLQERFYDSTPYLPESSGDDDETGGEAELDVAMCFSFEGESLGIGSANVFGGHGCHPY
ncbi:hypothetical protein JIQ42_06820 [Leishmania sp. Namibia]|uniref:hypothetical protein n=1 Tax=Leishmania sp. Namibia TaxID=2802991 RepID=UPI001B72B548|nr:hypothetical protein JIQ42_06820 [Leishmania sp. Namibia]